MKRNVLLTLAWTYTVTMFLATLPIGICLYSAAANETFTNDPEPKYLTRFMYFLIWPLAKLENEKS
jgi:hypothetical protein